MMGRFAEFAGAGACEVLFLSCAFRPVAKDATTADSRNPRRVIDMSAPLANRQKKCDLTPVSVRLAENCCRRGKQRKTGPVKKQCNKEAEDFSSASWLVASPRYVPCQLKPVQRLDGGGA